jgi:hypothetical protein
MSGERDWIIPAVISVIIVLWISILWYQYDYSAEEEKWKVTREQMELVRKRGEIMQREIERSDGMSQYRWVTTNIIGAQDTLYVGTLDTVGVR